MRRALLLGFGLILFCTAASAFAAPEPHSAPPPPPPPSRPAPAPVSHPASSPAGRGGAGTAMPFAGAGVGGGIASRGMSRSSSPLYPQQQGIAKYANPTFTPQQRVGVQSAQYICHQANGAIFYSYTPCYDAGGYQSGDYWDGAQEGDIYILNFYFLPGRGEVGEAGPAELGGIAQSRPTPGSAIAARSAAPRALWMQDPGAASVGMPTSRELVAHMPIQTNLSETPVSYAIVLHDGTALATVQPPKRSGNTIIGKDRTGHLYSVRASEVDLAASRLPDQAPTAAAHP